MKKGELLKTIRKLKGFTCDEMREYCTICPSGAAIVSRLEVGTEDRNIPSRVGIYYTIMKENRNVLHLLMACEDLTYKDLKAIHTAVRKLDEEEE